MAQCLFCYETRLTKEHLWPDWIVRLFKTRVPPRKGAYTATHYRRGQPVRSWRQNTITSRTRLVCQQCNNEWMSDVEQCAQPLLVPFIHTSRHHGPLTAEEHCALAAWVTLRSMVFESRHPEDRWAYYSDEDRRSFAHADPMFPPDNTLIWMGPFDGPRNSADYFIDNYISTRETVGVHNTTIILDQVAIAFSTWKGVRRRIDWKRFNADGWNDVVRLIWPACRGKPVYWPPPRYLTLSMLQTLRDRLAPSSITSRA